ncbi:serine hydrolase domain-containing protein [Candidatus Bipolaricaulota bacterium]
MRLRSKPAGTFLLILVCLAISVAAQTDEGYSYTPPVSIIGDWATGTLTDVGIAQQPIEDAIQGILDGDYERVHSVIIVKDGLLVLEEYFRGFTYVSPTRWAVSEVLFGRNRIHNLASLTKSITSVLVGAAIYQGFIRGVDEAIFSFFSELEDLITPEKDAITIEHLLTLTPGWQWFENTQMVEENCMYQFNIADSPLRYLVGLPMEALPGEQWTYNGGAVSLLGKLIEAASGMPIDVFANRHLFGPLGILLYRWPRMQYDFIATHGDLKLLPRDVAKIGQLMLNDGVWEGERLLPEGWVNASITSAHQFLPGEGFYYYTDYGYLWWLMDVEIGGQSYPSYTGAGWGGQRLIVIPDFNTIVMFNGGNYDSHEPVDDIMIRHILPALAGDGET